MVNDLGFLPEAVRPGLHVDRYVVEAKLGEGGAAVVYRVRHRQLGTLHALKVLRLLAGSLTDRLIREGRIQATLKHRNIVAVTDVVRVHAFPALVMEHVAGLSLDGVLARYRPDIAEIDALARDILEGMHAAHLQGMVHRDLKPGNILLQLVGDQVTAKISDFGLARILDGDSVERSTRTSVMMGTPAYMAPEQLRSAKDADHRADVFALGAVLYELASGRSAFGSNDLMATYQASSNGKYRPLDEVAPGLPSRWVQAVHAALQADPDHRPQSVSALAELWFAGAEPEAPAWHPELLRALAEPRETPPTSFEKYRTPTDTIIPAQPPKTPIWVFVTTALAVALVGTVGLMVAALSWTLPTTEPVAVVPPYVEVPEAPRREPAPSVVVTESVAPDEPVVLARATSIPRPPEIVLPASVVTPEPPPSTRFDVTGVERAWLEDALGRHLRPGAVPSGPYVLHVFFDPAKPTRVLTFTLGDGERRLVRCDSLTRICK